MIFSEKVVVITGAGSGIGAATALKFSKHSAKLALIDINSENLNRITEKCKGNGANSFDVVADLSKEEELLAVIPKVIAHYGKIDILVNVAGIMTQESILDEDVIENYDKLMSINLKAPIVLTNKAAPHLVKTKGNIVNVASIRSNRPRSDRMFYCISKAGLEMFTKCVALELASKGVRANSVHPGVVRTNLLYSSTPTLDLEDHYNRADQKLNFGVIEPNEVAGVIAFLASDDAKKVTGSSYYIDGGITIME